MIELNKAETGGGLFVTGIGVVLLVNETKVHARAAHHAITHARAPPHDHCIFAIV